MSRTYKEVNERPSEGRFGVVYMYGEDMWCLTMEWDGCLLLELDENGDRNYTVEYGECEFDEARFFVECEPADKDQIDIVFPDMDNKRQSKINTAIFTFTLAGNAVLAINGSLICSFVTGFLVAAGICSLKK